MEHLFYVWARIPDGVDAAHWEWIGWWLEDDSAVALYEAMDVIKRRGYDPGPDAVVAVKQEEPKEPFAGLV